MVVFDPPDSFWELSARKADGEALIKRVVAVAGDEVEVRSGQLTRTRTRTRTRARTRTRCAAAS